MPRHIRITCPNCRRPDLRIRPERLGQNVQCKYCDHVFRSQPPEDVLDAVTIVRNGDLSGLTVPPEEVRKSRGRVEQLELKVRTLEEQLEEARQKSERENNLLQEVEGAQASKVSGLEEAVRRELARADELRAELLPLREAARSPAPQVAAALAQERDALAAGRDRLRDEVEARAADTAGRLARLAEESNAARTQEERSRDEAQRLRGELDARSVEAEGRDRPVRESGQVRIERDRIREERDRLREEIQAVRAELEARSAEAGRLGDLAAELEAACRARDEARRQADELRVGRDRLETRHAEEAASRQDADRVGEAERDRLASERDQARQEARDAARRGDLQDEQLGVLRDEHDRVLRDRDAEARDHRRALEALGQELEAARRQAGRLEAERLEACRRADELAAGRDRLVGTREDGEETLRGERPAALTARFSSSDKPSVGIFSGKTNSQLRWMPARPSGF